MTTLQYWNTFYCWRKKQSKSRIYKPLSNLRSILRFEIRFRSWITFIYLWMKTAFQVRSHTWERFINTGLNWLRTINYYHNFFTVFILHRHAASIIYIITTTYSWYLNKHYHEYFAILSPNWMELIIKIKIIIVIVFIRLVKVTKRTLYCF